MDRNRALEMVTTAAADGKISPSAVENVQKWLTEPVYDDFVPDICQHVDEGKWSELNEAFWTVIPFGTGGRRGRMYPIGCNVINRRTIGESAQGLANYVKTQAESPLSCAIAYDTRHRSREFAELCAGIMVGSGFKVYFLDDYRSTPELSFLVRYKSCSCGIMVTASHNPPSDNAVKVYWSTGGQILGPHDRRVIEEVQAAQEIEVADFSAAVESGQIEICTDEVDRAFQQNVGAQSLNDARDVKIIYSPLHGVGASAVCPVLAAAGFADVEVYAPHAEPSGDFPNVPGHVSNPENPAVFDSIIERARQAGADLIMATDPDCDRLGCAAPLTLDSSGPWATLNGNQLCTILGEYVIAQRAQAGNLTPENFVVTTLVSTKMLGRVAEHYGIRCERELLVGFKWICARMDELGADKFLYGCEESHGYLVGQYARDKDAAVAALLLSEVAAKLKAEGKSLHEHLDSLYWQFGYHAERLVSVYMEGQSGIQQMNELLTRFREQPPQTIGGLDVVGSRGYQTPESGTTPIESPEGSLLMFELSEPGNYFAVRPSGTEPKIKFYMFTYVPAEQLADLETSKEEMDQRLTRIAADLKSF